MVLQDAKASPNSEFRIPKLFKNSFAEEVFLEIFYRVLQSFHRVARRKTEFLFGFRRIEIPEIFAHLDFRRFERRGLFPLFVNR